MAWRWQWILRQPAWRLALDIKTGLELALDIKTTGLELALHIRTTGLELALNIKTTGLELALGIKTTGLELALGIKTTGLELALDIKTNGLETGTGLLDYRPGSWNLTLGLLAWRLTLKNKIIGFETGTIFCIVILHGMANTH